MRAWLLRGCGTALLHAVAQVSLAAVGVYHVGMLDVLRPLALGLLVGAAVLWGALDTWFRRVDRGIVWLKASILAGLLAGLLGVIGRAAFVDQTGVSALGSALTGGAAFTALIILVPAGLGLVLGRLLGPRVSAHARSGAQGRERERSTPRG